MDHHFFYSLLYRYFFYDWLFKDASKGSLLERAAAWQHNLQQSRWLPVYMRRWIFLGMMFYSLGLVSENALAPPYVSAVFYVCMVGGLCVMAVIATAMLGFHYFPAPNNQR